MSMKLPSSRQSIMERVRCGDERGARCAAIGGRQVGEIEGQRDSDGEIKVENVVPGRRLTRTRKFKSRRIPELDSRQKEDQVQWL